MMSLNIDLKIIRPWNCAGFAHVVHELLDFVDELQCSESWEIFHSNSIGSPLIVSTVLPKQYLMLGSDSSFQDITQNLRTHKPLHARD